MTLTQGSLEKANSIQRLEEAATELYKALQAGRDTGRSARPSIFCVFVTLTSCYRYGGHYGKVARIQNTQCSILQTNVRLLVYHVYSASECF